jgi:hypothetical protein
VGNHERCLAFFQKLFSDCHQPPPAQNSLLREFLHLAAQIAQTSAASSELVASCLPVPVIDQQSVRLFLASYDPSRYHHNATRHATRHDTAHVWLTCRVPLIDSGGEQKLWDSLQSRVLRQVSAPRSSLPSSRPVSVIQGNVLSFAAARVVRWCVCGSACVVVVCACACGSY